MAYNPSPLGLFFLCLFFYSDVAGQSLRAGGSYRPCLKWHHWSKQLATGPPNLFGKAHSYSCSSTPIHCSSSSIKKNCTCIASFGVFPLLSPIFPFSSPPQSPHIVPQGLIDFHPYFHHINRVYDISQLGVFWRTGLQKCWKQDYKSTPSRRTPGNGRGALLPIRTDFLENLKTAGSESGQNWGNFWKGQGTLSGQKFHFSIKPGLPSGHMLDLVYRFGACTNLS